jgi:hypothetical protein
MGITNTRLLERGAEELLFPPYTVGQPVDGPDILHERAKRAFTHFTQLFLDE